MKKKLLGILIVGLLFIGLTGCGTKDDEAARRAENKVITGKLKLDYLVLVNKYTALPDDWEKKVELVEAQNAWDETIKLEKETYENYKKLKEDLEKDGVEIVLDSVYRSVSEQQELWDDWSVSKGIDYVRKYVAVPGFSEHHTGLAVDICIIKDGKLIEENDDMIAEREIFAKVHAKLADHGFILRYLEDRDDITGYAYEPWHLRYVGSTKIAKEIMDKDITFEEYIASIKDIKSNTSAAKYQIEIALQDFFKEIYGDKITNSRFNVTKIYSDEEAKDLDIELGDDDIAFEVTYQVKPAEGIDIDELTVPNGTYDEVLEWVKDKKAVGVLKNNDGEYSIENFGTGW